MVTLNDFPRISEGFPDDFAVIDSLLESLGLVVKCKLDFR